MKFRSILTAILAIAVTLSSTTATFASTNNNTSNGAPKISVNEQKAIDNRVILIAKMEPYVSLNLVTKQYEFKLTTKNNLTKSEINEATGLIAIANEKIRDAINQNITLTVTPEKTLRGTSNTNSGSIQPLNTNIVVGDINTDNYWDYDFLYWGERVYLHNNFVNDLHAWGNSIIYGIGITAAGMETALVGLGMTAPWALTIVAFFGGNAVYTYDRIVNYNTGHGVFCDSYYGMNYWKVYSAW